MTNALLSHQSSGFTVDSTKAMANTVCRADLAVPDTLWVSGLVTWIWKPVTAPMANPNTPLTDIISQKKRLEAERESESESERE